MKLILLRAGLLACLTLGLFYQEASAESDWASACSKYGEIKPNENPSFQHVNCLLTNAALEAKIPPEVVKALATQENGWKQFDEKGEPVIAKDGGIGLMQITNQETFDQEKLKGDILYNIEAGISILNSMYDRTTTELPKIKNSGRLVIENWYFPVMAYNGIKPVNSPIYQTTGAENISAYQEKVFSHIEQYSFLNETTQSKLGEFPFRTSDFQYDTASSKNIVFLKKEYTLNDPIHVSNYILETGDQVVVTEDNVSLRAQPGYPKGGIKLGKTTSLIIAGDFSYDQSVNSENQFVWYPVTTENQMLAGYISSAYITKKVISPAIELVEHETPIVERALIAETKKFTSNF